LLSNHPLKLLFLSLAAIGSDSDGGKYVAHAEGILRRFCHGNHQKGSGLGGGVQHVAKSSQNRRSNSYGHRRYKPVRALHKRDFRNFQRKRMVNGSVSVVQHFCNFDQRGSDINKNCGDGFCVNISSYGYLQWEQVSYQLANN
jgi:hypothetical protein